MQRSTGLDVPVGEETLREWRLLLAALAKRDLTEYARLSALFRLRRQVWIARTELVRSPRDPELRLATRQLEAGLRAAEQARSAQHDALTGAPPAGPAERAAGRPPLAAVMPWDKRAQWQAVAAMALLAIVFALPLLPDSLERSIWEFPILLAPLPALPLSAVNAVLAAVLLWRYVAAAGRPDAENTDELMQFRAEQAVLGVCLAVVLLVSLYVTVGNLFSPYPSTLAFYAGARLPNFERGGLATALLLFGVAASGITLGRTARWRRAAIEARRAAALRNVLAAGSVFALAWLCLTVYVNGLVELHHRVGATAFSLGSALGAHGNNLLAFVMIALVLVLSAVVGLALRSVTQRIERFFIGGELARWS